MRYTVVRRKDEGPLTILFSKSNAEIGQAFQYRGDFCIVTGFDSSGYVQFIQYAKHWKNIDDEAVARQNAFCTAELSPKDFQLIDDWEVLATLRYAV